MPFPSGARILPGPDRWEAAIRAERTEADEAA